MYLSVDRAIEFVRTHMDEIVSMTPDMIDGGEVDDRNLESSVRRLMEEAITQVHLQAAPHLLEGVQIDASSAPSSTTDEGVLDINFKNTGIGFLRLVSFKAHDSKFIITAAVPEDSVSGKLQHNKYLRGNSLDPILVYMRDSKDHEPHYRYYSTTETEPGFSMLYFPVPKETGEGYFVSAKLELATLNHLMGLVAQSYYMNEQAQVYFQKVTDEITQ